LGVVLNPRVVEVALERDGEDGRDKPQGEDGEGVEPYGLEPQALQPLEEEDDAGSAEVEDDDVENVDGILDLYR
jgi:hypothetical protein